MNEQEFYEVIGADIRRHRRLVDLRQADLADELQVTTNTVSRWETGVYHPSAYDLCRIARYFGLPLDVFLRIGFFRKKATKRAKGRR